MDEHTACEQAYKKGYEQGKKDAVAQGEWMPFEEWQFPTIYDGLKCSICGSKHNPTLARTYNFCPNCGAEMKGETE